MHTHAGTSVLEELRQKTAAWLFGNKTSGLRCRTRMVLEEIEKLKAFVPTSRERAIVVFADVVKIVRMSSTAANHMLLKASDPAEAI